VDAAEAPEIPRVRLAIGGGVFVVGWLAPVLVPWVASADGLSAEWKAGISGLLLLGIPELFSVVAIGILGREGFEFLKHRALRALRVLRPAQHVGKTRHRVGVAMFVMPLVLGWAAPYARGWIPEIVTHQVPLAIGGDIIFVSSLFVLGGSFWEKLHGLFVRDVTSE